MKEKLYEQKETLFTENKPYLKKLKQQINLNIASSYELKSACGDILKRKDTFNTKCRNSMKHEPSDPGPQLYCALFHPEFNFIL